MKTIPSAQAEHQLTQVADHFDTWRQTRTTRATPIPQDLWEQAIALTTMFPLTRVARRLRVSGGELKKRCAAHRTAQSTPVATTALGFVEVPAAPVWPLPTAGVEIELQRPDGTRLRLHAPEPQLPLLAIVRAFGVRRGPAPCRVLDDRTRPDDHADLVRPCGMGQTVWAEPASAKSSSVVGGVRAEPGLPHRSNGDPELACHGVRPSRPCP